MPHNVYPIVETKASTLPVHRRAAGQVVGDLTPSRFLHKELNALNINPSGVIAGFYCDASTNTFHGFVRDKK